MESRSFQGFPASMTHRPYIIRRFNTGSPIDGTHWLPNKEMTKLLYQSMLRNRTIWLMGMTLHFKSGFATLRAPPTVLASR